MLVNELKTAIHKMVDAISDKNILIKIYTFIKYLKQHFADGMQGLIPAPAYCLIAYV